MKRALLMGASALSLALGVSQALAANPLPNLTNLDFSQQNPGGTAPKTPFVLFNPTGWTGGSGLIFIAQNSPGLDAAGPIYLTTYGDPVGPIVPAGGNYVEADGNPHFESGFNYNVTGLTPGQTYSLTFYQGASQQTGFHGDTTDQWAVSLGTSGLYVASTSNPSVPNTSCGTHCGYFSIDPTASIQTSPLMDVPSGTAVGWNFVTMNLTADATNDLLSFLAWGNQGNTTNLPPIAFLAGVNSAAGLGSGGVPEPSTWVMMGIGFAGLGAAMRRRRRKRLEPAFEPA